MPAQYPGNAITKAARAKAGGGFESAIEAVLSTWRANEPSGLTQARARDFDSLEASGWYIGSTTENKSIESDATAPKSPPSVLRHTYPAGFSGGTAGTSLGTGGLSAAKLYVCFNVYWSPNWQNHPTGENKIAFAVIEDFGGGGEPTFLTMRTDEGRSVKVVNQGSGVARLFSNGGGVSLGKWHQVEVYLVSNSDASLSDGQMYLWVDGVLVESATDVKFWSDPSSQGKFNTFKFEPTWGGLGGTVSEDMYIQHDAVYIAQAEAL